MDTTMQVQQPPSTSKRPVPPLQSVTLPTSSSKSSFFVVPAVPLQQQPTTSRPQAKPSFTILNPPASIKQEQTPQFVQPQNNIVTYKAPAHKHAHHLHTIPPKEKTVQTLILDHMLWQHSRTRFNQVRSELGMQAGCPEGPSGKEASDADETELAHELLFGLTGDDRYKGFSVDANRYAPNVDIETAKVQRASAEGMEKVLASLLTQRTAGPRNVPQLNSGIPGILPNGVRIRIALSTLVNDLFARDQHFFDPDEQPENSSLVQSGDASPMSISSLLSLANGVASPSDSRGPMTFLPPPSLPASVSALVPITSFQQAKAKSNSASKTKPGCPPPRSIFSTIPRGAGLESPWALGTMNSSPTRGQDPNPAVPPSSLISPSSSSPSNSPISRGPRIHKAVGRSRELYISGVERRRPICVSHLTHFDECPPECLHAEAYAADKNGLLKLLTVRSLTTIGSGLPHAGFPLRSAIARNDANAKGKLNDFEHISGARLASLLPRFLRLSAFVARELGREMREQQQPLANAKDMDMGAETPPSLSAADIPSTTGDARPTRGWYALLSGMVTRSALEGYLGRGWLGAEALEVLFGIGIGVDWDKPFEKPADDRDAPANRPRSSSASSDIRPMDEDGVSEVRGSVTDASISEAYIAQFDPDGMPTLGEAARILFKRGIPSGAAGSNSESSAINSYANGFQTTRWSSSRNNGTNPEWDTEMTERVSEFASVPNTIDLHSHLLELAKRYPPEPVERAALRFLEAIALWRGTPELEQYKERVRKANTVATQPATSSDRRRGSLSISSLVHPTEGFDPTPESNPSSTFSQSECTSESAPILKYFIIPKHIIASPASTPNLSKKRLRDEGSEADVKRLKNPRMASSSIPTVASNMLSSVSPPPPSLIESSWTGPYGI